MATVKLVLGVVVDKAVEVVTIAGDWGVHVVQDVVTFVTVI